ncbi:NAD-P-binding protein [Earliella scabrosa]|nr:NAD-P-binding protein [Earliella scabrosa]
MTEEQPASRIALVTGAAQGIGEAIALQLADDGLDVAINDIPQKEGQLADVAKAIEAKGRRALIVCGDVSAERDVASMVSRTVTGLGGLDVMVANAGIDTGFKSITECEVDEWDRIMSVNGRGVFLCIKHAARHMIPQGRGGRIICASSDFGRSAFPGMAFYCASKFAIRGLMQSAALELRKHKITVNAYCPGMIKTPMTMKLAAEGGEETLAKVRQIGGVADELEAAEPSHIADLVSYLAKPETSYVTGQSYSVNGGLIVS